MSELAGGSSGNGRAANGGARTAAGPVPVSQANTSAQDQRADIRTPQMIMSARREREAQRAAEANAARAAEEQQRRAQEDERRKSAERRAQAAGVAGQTAQRQPQSMPLRNPGDSGYGGPSRETGRVVTSGGPVNPLASAQAPDTTGGAQYGRPRASSQSQQQTRPPMQIPPAPAAGTTENRRPQASTSHARQPSAPTGPTQARHGPIGVPPQQTQGGPSSIGGHSRNTTNVSSFPHAFERWETLSSHWEGLTSYWIRRLEQNTEEVRREPLAQQMSRQITDLSAAGANLFHAVVELQRLRASSERKFQRWFYEHRQEQERAQEVQAELEHAIQAEHQARTADSSAVERLTREKNNADRMVAEMRRELQISKEEARRAWEELGRREAEERARTDSLREGQPTLVGGVQVVPMGAGMASRHGSVSQRPSTRDEGYGSVPQGAQPTASHGVQPQYSYEETTSPTDTDPYNETARQPTALRHEPDVPALGRGTYGGGYPPSSEGGTSSSTARSAAPPQPIIPQAPAPLQPHRTTAQQPSVQQTTSQPEAFYQQPGTYLHEEVAASIPEDERSYVESQGDVTSEGDEEYVIDGDGNFVLDEDGHRVTYREHRLRQSESDEFDVQADRQREIEHLTRYGTAAGSYGGTTSTAGPAYPPAQGQSSYQTAGPVDYSGQDYGPGTGGQGYGPGTEWAAMRHHHPTRLSDVLEEDERSRTSPSRASQTSRGMY